MKTSGSRGLWINAGPPSSDGGAALTQSLYICWEKGKLGVLHTVAAVPQQAVKPSDPITVSIVKLRQPSESGVNLTDFLHIIPWIIHEENCDYYNDNKELNFSCQTNKRVKFIYFFELHGFHSLCSNPSLLCLFKWKLNLFFSSTSRNKGLQN